MDKDRLKKITGAYRRLGDLKTHSVGFWCGFPKALSTTLLIKGKRTPFEILCPVCFSLVKRWVNWYASKENDDDLIAECEQGHTINDLDLLVGNAIPTKAGDIII